MILSYAVTCERARWLALCISFCLLFGDEFVLGLTQWISCCNTVTLHVGVVWETGMFSDRLVVVDGAPFVVNTRSTVLLEPWRLEGLLTVEGKPARFLYSGSIRRWSVRFGGCFGERLFLFVLVWKQDSLRESSLYLETVVKGNILSVLGVVFWWHIP
jgi:hypothetical protein